MSIFIFKKNKAPQGEALDLIILYLTTLEITQLSRGFPVRFNTNGASPRLHQYNSQYAYTMAHQVSQLEKHTHIIEIDSITRNLEI